MIIFLVSAILGDACNYMIGEEFGHRILRNYPKLIKPQHIQKAEAFYAKHGHKAIFLARFAPIVSTLAPFVAGIGSMHYRTFAIYNVTGAVTWVFLFVGGGYLYEQYALGEKQFFPCYAGHHYFLPAADFLRNTP